MVTFPRQYENSDKNPDIDQLLTRTIVPAVVGDAAWTLNLMTIEADGDVGGNAVAVGAYAERWVPGVIQGHLYKVTIAHSFSLDTLVVTMGGQTLGTLSGVGTAVFYVRPSDGDKLRFEHASGANFTGAITSCVVEMMDPMNVELVPTILT